MSDNSTRTSRVVNRLFAMERELRHLEGFDGWVIGSCSFTVSTAIASSMESETKTQLSLLRKSENRALIQIWARDVPSNEQMRKALTNDQTCEALADVPSKGAADQMRVLLLRPTAPILAKANTEPDHEISNWDGSMDEPPRCASVNIPPEGNECHPYALSFSTEEIDLYLDRVSDYNSIHRGADAIVPGFLMMNRLFEIFLEVETPPRCNEAAGRAGHSENASRWSGSDEKAPGLIQVNVKFPAPLKAGEPVFLFRTSDFEKTPSCCAEAHIPPEGRGCLPARAGQARQARNASRWSGSVKKTRFLLRDRAGQIILNMKFF